MNQVGVLDRWLGKKRSRVSWASILNRFRVFAGCDSFEDLLGLEDPRGVVLDWFDCLDLAPGSVNSYVSRVKSFYLHFGVDLGDLPRVRGYVKFPHKVLTLDEIRLMVRYADVRGKALIWFLYSSGARIGSVLGLNCGRVDFRGSPPVKVHFYAHETKYNVAYDTFLCSEAFEVLKRYVRWRQRRGFSASPDSPLWITKYGTRIGYAGCLKNMKIIIEKAGIQIEENERLGHHSFRGAFHRNLQVAGVNQYIIEKLMGHSLEQTMTGRYSLGVTSNDVREAYLMANWSLEVDEARVRELEGKVEETQKVLGSQTVENQLLRETQGKRIEDLEEQLRKQSETLEKLLDKVLPRG